MTPWLRHALLAMVCLAAVLAGYAADDVMRASKPAVKKEIVTVIESQLAAFRKGDVAKAHTFAAADLRAQKPQPVFAAIVQESYPEIWSNTRAEFGIVRDNGMQATVTVQVYSKAGDAAYDFTLVKESAGWRIYGVLRHAPKQRKNARLRKNARRRKNARCGRTQERETAEEREIGDERETEEERENARRESERALKRKKVGE